jgi:hypothetical protein
MGQAYWRGHETAVELGLHLRRHPEAHVACHIARLDAPPLGEGFACAVEDELDVGEARVRARDLGRVLVDRRAAPTQPPPRARAAQLVQHHAHRATPAAVLQRARHEGVGVAPHAAQQEPEHLDGQISHGPVKDFTPLPREVRWYRCWRYA